METSIMNATHTRSPATQKGLEDRFSQYESQNVSAAKRGNLTREEEGGGEDWVTVDHGPSDATPPCPPSLMSGSDSVNTNIGTDTDMHLPAADNSSKKLSELSKCNIEMHNLLNDKEGVYERLWKREGDSKESNPNSMMVNPRPVTWYSNVSDEVGGPYVPVDNEGPDSLLYKIGIWANPNYMMLQLSDFDTLKDQVDEE